MIEALAIGVVMAQAQAIIAAASLSEPSSFTPPPPQPNEVVQCDYCRGFTYKRHGFTHCQSCGAALNLSLTRYQIYFNESPSFPST